MLKEILSISGKPGLFKLISQAKNLSVVESVVDRKRIPVYPRDRVVSLANISIYTNKDEVPLEEVFKKIKEKEEAKPLTFDASVSAEELRTYFETVLPEFDRERVYVSDIKKLLNWYNILIKVGLSNFNEEEKEKVSSENPSNEAEAEPGENEKEKKHSRGEAQTPAPKVSKKKTVAARQTNLKSK